MARLYSRENPPPRRRKARKKVDSWPSTRHGDQWRGVVAEFGYRPALSMLCMALCDDVPLRQDACQHCSGPLRGDEVPVTILRGAWCHPHCASLFMRPFVDRARQLLDRYLAKDDGKADGKIDTSSNKNDDNQCVSTPVDNPMDIIP